MSSGGPWRTLLLLYSAVLVAAVCVPVATIVPLLLGADSFLPLVCAGSLGLVLAGGGVWSLVGRYDTRAARAEDVAVTTRPNGADDGTDETTPGDSR